MSRRRRHRRASLATFESSPLAARLRDALDALLHPPALVAAGAGACSTAPIGLTPATARPAKAIVDVDVLVMDLFAAEGASLVRLARLFVDDRNAAEDLVQEAFIRLGRAAHRIRDPSKAAPYLRSIVLNLARDNNRRGLVSMRHHLPFDDAVASVEDEITLREDQRQVIDALRDLPHRQRDCLTLRFYNELGIAEIAETLGLSPNSVKTHLQRGLPRWNVDWPGRRRDRRRGPATGRAAGGHRRGRGHPRPVRPGAAQHRRRPAPATATRPGLLPSSPASSAPPAPSSSPSPNLEKGSCSWTGGSWRS